MPSRCAAAASTRPRRRCSELDCTTPLPDQRDLGDTSENDCQKSIGKAGVKHLLAVEKILEKCGLAGGTSASCLADLDVQAAIDKSEQKLAEGIHNKCGNRDPVPSVPFCCKIGHGERVRGGLDPRRVPDAGRDSAEQQDVRGGATRVTP